MNDNKIFSNFMRDIKANKFVFTGELEPEKTTDLSEMIEDTKPLKGHVVACNVTDGPRACAYMNSLVASCILEKETGIEMIYQLTCRDRNIIALTADLLGAGALGIKNVLALTGDHPKLGDTPYALPVYDLDSAQLTSMIRKMVDDGVDLSGKPIHNPPKFHVGVAANPNADPLEPEILKLERKVEAGAEFIQTQVVFDLDLVNRFLDEIKSFKIPILIGTFPMKNYTIADFFDKNVPGVSVPPDLLAALKKAEGEKDKKLRKQKYDEVNLEFYVPFIKELKKTYASGCHIMAVGYERLIPRLIGAVT
ncbi:MAG: methylenetetrahydrofolate reductase [Candidatus Bathyarchaeota archaeon]